MTFTFKIKHYSHLIPPVFCAGDVLNRLVHNLGEPLDFPYENGDWNIASMAINIYVLNYLKETQQLEHSMKEEEAVNFLKKGKFLSAPVLNSSSSSVEGSPFSKSTP